MRVVISLSALCLGVSVAHAADVTFASNPFAGSTALETPGRQVVGNNELFLATFELTTDRFVVDNAFFNVGNNVYFANDFATNLPTSGLNVIVLQDTDNDANAATAFNAGSAANIIASRINTPGAGLFVYWNSSLNVNRLVYSTNLDDNTADLSILARITTPTGADAIAALPQFTSGNFAIVPSPASAALLGLAGLTATRRRR